MLFLMIQRLFQYEKHASNRVAMNRLRALLESVSDLSGPELDALRQELVRLALRYGINKEAVTHRTLGNTVLLTMKAHLKD